MNYVVVDVETTGGTPKESKIIELSMFRLENGIMVDEFTTLIHPECSISPFIQNFTGINNDMVEDAPKFYEVAKRVLEISKDCIFVAHNVGFDYGMYRREFMSLGYDFRLPHLCTVRASRIILPGHLSYSLGKLTRDLGIKINGRHRARGDAEATVELFHILIDKDPNQLETFVQKELNPAVLHPNLDLHALETLPSKAGIYKFFDEVNRLIYIGKSKNIKTRIHQHLRNTKTKKGIEMQAEIARIEFELTGSEIVALLLESKLVKQSLPKHNIALKGSSFPFGVYDYLDQNGYLRFMITTVKTQNSQPIQRFKSRKTATEYLQYMIGIHTLCDKLCGISKTTTSCFGHSIKTCNGACIQEENFNDYNLRAQLLCEKTKFPFDDCFIIEEGRDRSEKCLILIERGELVGWGYASYQIIKKSTEIWRKSIEIQEFDRDAQTSLLHYFKSNPSLKIKKIMNDSE